MNSILDYILNCLQELCSLESPAAPRTLGKILHSNKKINFLPPSQLSFSPAPLDLSLSLSLYPALLCSQILCTENRDFFPVLTLGFHLHQFWNFPLLLNQFWTSLQF
ncbi:hypothetical protein RIF29_38892 [Crotalaria pallida]|uniref:Uncharacterized protein n=1 Tax=Crotalaria pallida TaxID=3830 RepID=A0AAN9E0N5_CROPI